MRRLKRLETYAGEQLVSDYRLTYQHSATTGLSLISSVTRCGGSGVCLPATTFTWPDADSISWGPSITFDGSITGWGVTFNYDVSGDGQADSFYTGPRHSDGSSQLIGVGLSNGDGTFGPLLNRQMPTPGNFAESPYAGYLDDFSGDGISDIVFTRPEWTPTSDSWRISMGISNADGTFTPVLWSGKSMCAAAAVEPFATVNVHKADFNGDGRADLLLSCPGPTDLKTRVAFSNGDGTFTAADWLGPSGNYTKGALKGTFSAVDINGDGRTDLLLIGDGGTSWQARVYLSIGDGTFTPPMTWPVSKAYSGLRVVDLNGDGLADISMVKDWPGAGYAAYSKGDGTFAEPVQLFGVPLGGRLFETSPHPDFNSDGLIEGSGVGNPILRPMKADGTYGEPIPLPSDFGLYLDGDINGDGRRDIISLGSPRKARLTSPRAYSISTIANGLGAKVAISYQPLSGVGTPYVKETGATYPIRDVQAPIYVVSKVDISDGIGSTLSSQYSYVGAKADLSGRGFLGFRQVSVTHLDTNVVKTSNYRQNFPYIGLVSSETTVRSGVTLKATATIYDAANLGGTRHVVFTRKKVETVADLNGTPLPTVTTDYLYDGYANATQVTSSTTDGFSSTATHTYASDEANWRLGQLTATQVTRQAP